MKHSRWKYTKSKILKMATTADSLNTLKKPNKLEKTPNQIKPNQTTWESDVRWNKYFCKYKVSNQSLSHGLTLAS